MKIAMLTYSVKPRGGVVHALEVSEALARRGHRVELMALARHDEELYRPPAVPLHVVRHVPPDAPFDERVQAMLTTYADGLRPLLAAGGYDVVHSQDCLSANAALELRDDGVIPHVIRTVHHVDDFTSPSLVECQERSITEPDRVLCVSPPWVERLAEAFGRSAELVRNGVDTRRFRPALGRARARPRPRALGAGRPIRGPDRRRDRAAQGLADAGAGRSPSCGGSCRSATRCSWWRAASRCSTTGARSSASRI